ncbi:MAG: hypothetical protein V3T22_06515 [Planctomycetota bacterium]
MVTLGSLWLAILLGGLAVFLASFVMRMVLKHHWTDFQLFPNEEAIRSALRACDVQAGQYAFPHCDGSDKMKDPEWIKAYEEGPTGFMFIAPRGSMAFGKSLVQSFLFNVFVAFVAAYLATIGLDAAASGSDVLRFTATVGFLGFGAATVWGPIWMSQSWKVCGKELLDALVYGLAMGAVFMALWPSGA